MVNLFIYEQKTVVGFVEMFYFDGRILAVVAVDIQLELLIDILRVDGGGDTFSRLSSRVSTVSST